MEDSDKGEIYMIVNKINNKMYIGQTKCIISNRKYGAKQRWNVHKYRAINSSNDCNFFYNAIRKYGNENFELSVLIKCKLEELDFYETKYIKEYNTIYPSGYNIETGGKLNKNLNNITKERLSNSKRFKYIKNKEDIDKIKQIMLELSVDKLPKGIIYTHYGNSEGFIVSLENHMKQFTSIKRTLKDNLSLAIEYYNIFNSKNLKLLEKFNEYVDLDTKIKSKNNMIKNQDILNAMKHMNIESLPLYIRYESRSRRFFVKIPNNPNKYFRKNDPIKSLEEALDYLKAQSLKENHILIPQKT